MYSNYQKNLTIYLIPQGAIPLEMLAFQTAAADIAQYSPTGKVNCLSQQTYQVLTQDMLQQH